MKEKRKRARERAGEAVERGKKERASEREVACGPVAIRRLVRPLRRT